MIIQGWIQEFLKGVERGDDSIAWISDFTFQNTISSIALRLCRHEVICTLSFPYGKSNGANFLRFSVEVIRCYEIHLRPEYHLVKSLVCKDILKQRRELSPGVHHDGHKQ